MEVDIPDIAIAQVDRLEPQIHPMRINKHLFYLLHVGDIKWQKRLRPILQCPSIGIGRPVAELHIDMLNSNIECGLIQQSIGKILQMPKLSLQVHQELLKHRQLVKLMGRVVQHVLPEPVHSYDLMVQDMPMQRTGEVPRMFQRIDIDVVNQPRGDDDDHHKEQQPLQIHILAYSLRLLIFLLLHYIQLIVMIRILSNVMANSQRLLPTNRFAMSMLTDYFTKKQLKKQEGDFKKEMEYLANKPVFTLMDYKQRIEDELGKIKGQLRAKFNQEAQEAEKNLEMEKKVMCALFEEELNMQIDLKFKEKTEISLVSQLPVDFVTKTLGKFTEYKNMHRLLRQLRLNNQPLPQTHHQFQQLYLASSISRDNPKFKYHKYKPVNEIQRRRHMKKTHEHGYFFP